MALTQDFTVYGEYTQYISSAESCCHGYVIRWPKPLTLVFSFCQQINFPLFTFLLRSFL